MSNDFSKDNVDYPFGRGIHVLILDKKDSYRPIAVKKGEDVVWMTLENAEALLQELPKVLREARRIYREEDYEKQEPVRHGPIRRMLDV